MDRYADCFMDDHDWHVWLFGLFLVCEEDIYYSNFIFLVAMWLLIMYIGSSGLNGCFSFYRTRLSGG